MCRWNKSRAITPTEEAAGNTPEDFLSLKGPSPPVISLFHETAQKADSRGKEMARGSSFCRVSIVEGGLFAKGRTPPQCLRSHFCKSAKGINANTAGVEIEAIDKLGKSKFTSSTWPLPFQTFAKNSLDISWKLSD